MDAAASCAMMLQLAHVLKELKIRPNGNDQGKSDGDVTIQLIFFDGEEALGPTWIPGKDSTYGSRHLAAKLKRTLYSPGVGEEKKTELDRIVRKSEV